MNHFPMKKLAAGIIVALNVAAVAPAYAVITPTGKEKVAIKIAPAAKSIGTDKNAKKMVKGVSWTPCVKAADMTAGVINYRTENTVPTPITTVTGKVTDADSLNFTLTASDASADKPVYFYLVDPTGTSYYGPDTFHSLVFTNATLATLETPYVTTNKAFTLAEMAAASGGFNPLTDYLFAGNVKKWTQDVNFDNVTAPGTVAKLTTTSNISASQGTWTAVAFIADKTLTPAELLDPKNWLASAIQPFVLGTPYANTLDCNTAAPAAVAVGGGGGGGGADTTAPAFASIGVNTTAKTITLTFTDAGDLANNTADAAALKAAVTVSTDNGTAYAALATADTVTIAGKTLVITFDALPTLTSLKVKVDANALKDTATTPNVLATATEVGIPPLLVSATGAGLVGEAEVVLTFNEAITNALADVTALEQAITYSTDGGTTWSAAGAAVVLAGDGSSISGSTLTIGFLNGGSGNTILYKVAAGALKDSDNNVLSEDVITGTLDTEGPTLVYAADTSSSTAADTVTVVFDGPIVNNLADAAALKAAITTSADGGLTTAALATADTVAISGSNLVITFDPTRTGNTVYIHIAAGTLKDANNNVNMFEDISNLTTAIVVQ